MNLRFGEVTRGSGKVFVRIAWDERVEGCTVRVASVSKSGVQLPAVVVPGNDELSCVAILAIFRVGQRLDVTLVDAGEQVIARASKYLTPIEARLKSQFNTLQHNQAAEGIRNIDARGNGLGMSFSFDERNIYKADDGSDVVHGTVRLAGRCAADVQGDLELRFFNQFGESANAGDWVLLSESNRDPYGQDVYHERIVSFSVKIPVDVRTLACWASVETPRGRIEALACLQEYEMITKRLHWTAFTDSAQTSCIYHDWFVGGRRTNDFELEAQRMTRFPVEPTFSIVVPVFHTPLEFFREMADSVLGQTYGRLELILVNASPDDEQLCNEMASLAASDKRVRIVALDANLGIVGNTYEGVDAATGDFVAFFDHDDVLELDLLYRYVEGINQYPTTDLLYCDEDKLENGRFVSPLFKPDWNIDLLRSSNYVCHMLTVRRSILEELPREGLEAYEGSQDHFLTLFAGERARNIYHARRVLYHWRIHAQSTAATADSKSYTEEAGVRAVQASLDRCGIHAVARPSKVSPNTYHVDYVLDEMPLVSIVIPNKDMVPILDRCVMSILNMSTYHNFEIVIVENNSTEAETFAFYDELQARDARVRVIRQETDGTFNFSRTVNFGVRAARGEYLLLLNNDIEVIAPDWIEKMLGPLQREEVGVVGAKLLYPDGLLQHVGVFIHKDNGAFHMSALLPSNSQHYYNFAQLTACRSAVTAACMLVRRDVYEGVGGFDEAMPVDYNDVDFCLRVRARGLLVVYEPEAVLMHYESISRGAHQSVKQRENWVAERGLMMQRWPSFFVEGDPYNNPNLGNSAYYQLQP